MELEQQLKVLIDDAENHGVSPIAIQKAIAPVLKMFAHQLQHLEYYIWQNLEQDWVLTTITNPQLSQTKNVIYAFITAQDAAILRNQADSNLIAKSIPIAHLLFRLISLQQVDSIIFLENSHNLNQGVEIEREHLSELIQQQIQQLNNISHIA